MYLKCFFVDSSQNRSEDVLATRRGVFNEPELVKSQPVLYSHLWMEQRDVFPMLRLLVRRSNK